jgi:hypothetical protein
MHDTVFASFRIQMPNWSPRQTCSESFIAEMPLTTIVNASQCLSHHWFKCPRRTPQAKSVRCSNETCRLESAVRARGTPTAKNCTLRLVISLSGAYLIVWAVLYISQGFPFKPCWKRFTNELHSANMWRQAMGTTLNQRLGDDICFEYFYSQRQLPYLGETPCVSIPLFCTLGPSNFRCVSNDSLSESPNRFPGTLCILRN